MRRINCFLKINDHDFKSVLEGLLVYSGYFNILNELTEEEMIVFCDEENKALDSKDKNDLSKILHLLEVNHYSSFTELLAEVNECMGDMLGYDLSPQFGLAGKVKRIGVYSGKGGIGSTAICESMAKLLYRMGYKTMVLDFSPVKIEKGKQEEEGSRMEMANLIYNLMRGRDIDIEQYTYSVGGPHYLRRGIVSNCFDVLDDELMNKIADSANNSGFDFLLMDFGSHLDRRNSRILKSLDAAVCVMPLDIKSMESGFYGTHELTLLGPMRTVRVLNAYRGNLKEKDYIWASEQMEGTDLIIPYQRKFGERSIDGDYGKLIRILVDNVIGRVYA